MIPFPGSWPRLGDHNQTGECKVFNGGDDYFLLSNMPALPPENEMTGRVVLIAGKGKASSKSVISHRLMHELSGVTRTPIDLMDEDELNLARENGSAFFSRIIDWAGFYQLIEDPDAKPRILGKQGWVLQNAQFFRELEGKCMVVRLGRPDATISIRDVADDILKYARSARYLKGSIYLYEYGYDQHDRWQELVRLLHRDGERVILVEIPMLSVDDAMKFIDQRIAHYPDGLPLDRAGVKRFFREVAAQHKEMHISLGGLSDIMRDAYEKSEARHERRVSRQRVMDAYYRYRAGHFWDEGGDVS